MYGTNIPLPLIRSNGQDLSVVSVFETLQGEGPLAGRAATFVRFAGCHLRCWFCDTDFSTGAKVWRKDDLMREIMSLHPRLVVLTGGEPMRQNILPLAYALWLDQYEVQIETAGNFWFQDDNFTPEDLRDALTPPGPNISIVVSPKGPTVHELIAQHACAWKYIIPPDPSMISEFDGLPVVNYQNNDPTARRHRLARPNLDRMAEHRVYVQPMDHPDKVVRDASLERCLEAVREYGYTLSLQQHKILGVP